MSRRGPGRSGGRAPIRQRAGQSRREGVRYTLTDRGFRRHRITVRRPRGRAGRAGAFIPASLPRSDLRRRLGRGHRHPSSQVPRNAACDQLLLIANLQANTRCYGCWMAPTVSGSCSPPAQTTCASPGPARLRRTGRAPSSHLRPTQGAVTARDPPRVRSQPAASSEPLREPNNGHVCSLAPHPPVGAPAYQQLRRVAAKGVSSTGSPMHVGPGRPGRLPRFTTILRSARRVT